MAKPRIWKNQTMVTGNYFTGSGVRNNKDDEEKKKNRNVPKVQPVTDKKGYLNKRTQNNSSAKTTQKKQPADTSIRKNQTPVTGEFFGSGRRNTAYSDFTTINNSLDSSLKTRQTADILKDERAKNEKERAQKRKDYGMGEAGAQDMSKHGTKRAGEQMGESGAQGQLQAPTSRTKAQIDQDYENAVNELQMKRDAYNERAYTDETYKNSIKGRRDAAYIRSLEERVGKLKNEKPRIVQETVKTDPNIEQDSVTNYYQSQYNKSIQEIEDLENDYAAWGEMANESITNALMNSDFRHGEENGIYNLGRQRNPYRKSKNGTMTESELQMYDVLFALGLDDIANDGVRRRGNLVNGVDEVTAIANKLNDRMFEVDKIVADKYKVRSAELKEQANALPFGEERSALEKQSSDYKQMGLAYQKRSDQMNNQIKFDQMYEQDKAVGKALAEKGRQTDTFLNMSEEDRKWSASAALLGSLNRDDSYKTASSAMTDEELEHYYFVAGLEAEGKVPEGAAKRYLKSLYDNGLNTRFSQKYSESLAKVGEDMLGRAGMDLGSFEVTQGFLNGLVRVGDSFQGIGMSINEAITGKEQEEVISEKLLDSVLASEKARTGNVGIDIAETIGFMMPAVVASVATGGAGAPAVVGILASSGSTFATTYGDAYLQTRREGYDPEEASAYAAINASLEAGLQSVLTGVSSISGGILTDAFATRVGSNAEQLLMNFAQSEGRTAFSRAAIKLAGNPLFRKIFKNLAVSAASGIGEFTEESLQEVLDPIVRNMILNENNDINPFNENVMYAGGMGFLVSVLMNVPSSAAALSKTGQRGAEIRENADALVKDGLSRGEGTAPYNTAKWIQANPNLNTDLMLGILEEDIKAHDQMRNDIQLYRDSVIELEDLSATARADMFDPRHAKTNAVLYGVDINEKMSPMEIRQKFEEAHNEKIIQNEQLKEKLMAENNLREVDVSGSLGKFLKKLGKLGNKSVYIADSNTNANATDAIKNFHGFVTRDMLVLNSAMFDPNSDYIENLAYSESDKARVRALTTPEEKLQEAIRYTVSHELSHLVQNSSAFYSLSESARTYYEDTQNADWDSMVAEVQRQYAERGQNLSYVEATHELVGNYFREVLFTDFDSLKKFVYNNTSTARKILSTLRDFVKGERTQEASYVREAVSNLERAFAEVQSEHYNPDVTTMGNSEQRYTLSEDTGIDLNSMLANLFQKARAELAEAEHSKTGTAEDYYGLQDFANQMFAGINENTQEWYLSQTEKLNEPLSPIDDAALVAAISTGVVKVNEDMTIDKVLKSKFCKQYAEAINANANADVSETMSAKEVFESVYADYVNEQVGTGVRVLTPYKSAFAEKVRAYERTAPDPQVLSDIENQYNATMQAWLQFQEAGNTEMAEQMATRMHELVSQYAYEKGFIDVPLYHGRKRAGFVNLKVSDHAFLAEQEEMAQTYTVRSDINGNHVVGDLKPIFEMADPVALANMYKRSLGSLGDVITFTSENNGTFIIRNENNVPEHRTKTLTRTELISELQKKGYFHDGKSLNGIYELYVDPGDNPLIINADNAYWSTISLSALEDTNVGNIRDRLMLPPTRTNLSTDDLATFARRAGYTSLVIESVNDASDANHNQVVGHDIIVFDQTQVKSADFLTKDNDGNPIPLSQRFERTGEHATDLRYAKAGTSTNAEMAQKAQRAKMSERATALAQKAADAEDVDTGITFAVMANRLTEIEDSRAPGLKPKKSSKGLFTMRREAYRDLLKHSEKNDGKIDPSDIARVYNLEQLCSRVEQQTARADLEAQFDSVLKVAVSQNEKVIGLADKEIARLRKMVAEQLTKFSRGDVSKAKALDAIENMTDAVEIKKWAQELKKADDEYKKYLNQLNREAKKQANAEKKMLDKTLKKLTSLKKMPTYSEEYSQAVSDILGNIYLGSKSMMKKTQFNAKLLTEAWTDIQDQQKEYAESLDKTVEEAIADGDIIPVPLAPDLQEKMDRHGLVALKDLSPQQVAEIYQSAQALSEELRGIRADKNKYITFGDETVGKAEFASRLIDEVKSATGKYSGLKGLFGLSSLNAKSVFNKLGGYKADSAFMKMYDTLQKGQVETFKANAELTDIIKKFETEHKAEFAEWTKKHQKPIDTGVDVKTIEGDTVRLMLTPQQRMSLYMHMQNADNLAHIVGHQVIEMDENGKATVKYGKTKKTDKIDAEGNVMLDAEGNPLTEEVMEEIGGMVVPDPRKKGAEAVHAGIEVKPTYEQLVEVVKGMSKEEIAFCETAREMFDRAAELVNKVSLEEVGYFRMLVDNYFPIFTKSSGGDVKANAPTNDDMIDWNMLSDDPANAEIFRERGGDIKTAIVLADITGVINSYIDKVSNYVGLALPLKNINLALGAKAENGLVVKDRIDKADTSGKNSLNKYLRKLRQDLVGQRVNNDILDRMRSHYAQGVLGLNIGVVLKQAASYPTAAAVVGHKALVKGFARKVDENIVKQYSPYYAYRTMGKGDVSLGDITSTSRAARILDKFDLIQKMDLATVRRLWGAAEAWVEDNRPELERGTQAYYEAVGEMHGRIIAETQPNYTMLERPQVLRSDSPTVRSLLMFRTQLMQNYNLMYDSIAEYNARKKAGTLTNSDRTRLGRTVSSQLVAASTIAAISIANGLIRGFDDDLTDEDGKLDMSKFLKSFGLRGLESFAGMFIGGSEAVAAGEKIYEAVTGDDLGGNDFDVTMPQVEMINDLGTGFINLIGVMANPESENNEKLKAIQKMGFAVSRLFGLPVENVMKYVTGIPQALDNFGLTDGSYSAWYDNLFYGTSLQDIAKEKHGNIREQKLETLISNRMPSLAGTKAGDEIVRIYKDNIDENGISKEGFKPEGMLLQNYQTLYTDTRNVPLTKSEKERFNNLANKYYLELAEEFVNSPQYADLDDWDRHNVFSDIASHAMFEARRQMAKEMNLTVSGTDDIDKAKELGISNAEYMLWKSVDYWAHGTESDKKWVLSNLNISDDAKLKIYKDEFEKEGSKKTIDAAVQGGMTVKEYIHDDAMMDSFDELEGTQKDRKTRYIIDKYSDENGVPSEKAAEAYHWFVEGDNVKYEDSILYAKDNGISPAKYLQRERELAEPVESHTEFYTKNDLKYKNGELVESNEMKSKNESDLKKARVESLMNGGYTDEEMIYFYQKEYPNDDGFAVGVSIGLDPETYLSYVANSGMFVADKDENGNSISGSKKAKIVAFIDAMEIEPIQKLALIMTTNTYKHTKEEYQSVIDLVNSQNMPKAMKLRVFDELHIKREGDKVYPEKAK